jgi:hypothetical protein
MQSHVSKVPSGHLKRHAIGRIDRALVRPFNPDGGEVQ